MKIALLTDGIYPYVIGGMQKHSFQLAHYLAKKGHIIYLFHCNASSYNIDNLEFFSDEEKKNIKSFVITFPRHVHFPFHYFYESRKYAQLLASELSKVIDEIDFVFAQGFCASALPSKKKGFPPVALHLHGLEMFQRSPSFKEQISKYIFRVIAKANLKKADYAISYGGKITVLLNNLVKKEQIWEIPGAVNEDWVTLNKKGQGSKIRFVFVGRYERRKGIEELHAALKLLLPSDKFTFDFISPIPDECKIKSKELHYHGGLSSEADIKQILSNCDVLICPSYAEGMPYVIMEGMACGLAIIATDVGAVSLLVNNDNGWLINHSDAKEIAKAISAVLNEKAEVLEQKKIKSSEKIKAYTFEKVTDCLIEHMEESSKKYLRYIISESNEAYILQ